MRNPFTSYACQECHTSGSAKAISFNLYDELLRHLEFQHSVTFVCASCKFYHDDLRALFKHPHVIANLKENLRYIATRPREGTDCGAAPDLHGTRDTFPAASKESMFPPAGSSNSQRNYTSGKPVFSPEEKTATSTAGRQCPPPSSNCSTPSATTTTTTPSFIPTTASTSHASTIPQSFVPSMDGSQPLHPKSRSKRLREEFELDMEEIRIKKAKAQLCVDEADLKAKRRKLRYLRSLENGDGETAEKEGEKRLLIHL